MATISTHNGSTGSTLHNDRDELFIQNEMAKQEREKGTRHIRADGEHETWRKGDVRQFYDETFSESVQEYNAKQKREDRKISDYYEKICQDKKKHPFYEMIVGVYGSDVSPEVGKAIVKEFFDGWDERNPNLKLWSCNWHNDEQNANLNGHAHFDYTPVCYNCKTGPKVGTSLNQALKEMGFIDKGPLTAQIQWQQRENKLLEEICRRHGIIVERPKEKRAHQEKDVYILEQRAEEAAERLSEADQAYQERIDSIVELDVDIAKKTAERDALTASLGQSADSVQQLNEDVRHAINSSRKKPIERLKENPPQLTIFGKEKVPATSLVKTAQLDELERSPGLTPSDTWKLHDIEKGIKSISASIDNSRERQLEQRIEQLERSLRHERQINRAMSNKIQLFKDWIIDIVEKELSFHPIAQRIVQSITSKLRSSIDSIERTAIDMNQDIEQHHEH